MPLPKHECPELKDQDYNLVYYDSDGWVLHDEKGFTLKFMEYCPMCGLKLEE